MNEFIVIAARLIFPLTILRFPFLGALLAIAIDYYDFELLRLLGGENLEYYQNIDKTLDIYYLSFEAYISLFWKNKLAKYTAVLLFTYRLLGFIMFLVVQNQMILVIFPNVFEAFYLFYLGFKKIFKKDPITSVKVLPIILLILFIPKMIHEYFLHVNTTHPWTENVYLQMFLKLIFTYFHSLVV